MAELFATVTSKGQVTVPAPVRRHLGLEARDKIAFVIEPDGTVRVQAPRFPTVASLRGAAGTLKRPIPWQQMRETAREDQGRRVAPGRARPARVGRRGAEPARG